VIFSSSSSHIHSHHHYHHQYSQYQTHMTFRQLAYLKKIVLKEILWAREFVCWLVLWFVRSLRAFSKNIRERFSWNITISTDVLRGQGQSSRSKLPYWISSNLHIAPPWFEISSPNLAVRQTHRRRSSVNFRRARHFCPKKYVWKIYKMPEFYIILARKIIKIPEFLWYLPEKLTKFPIFTRFLPE